MEIRIDGWEANVRFSASHFIPSQDKCERLHGHEYAISATITGEKGPGGLLLDFVSLKRALRSIAEELDHRVLVPKKSAAIDLDVNDEVSLSVHGKKYVFPKEDVILLDVNSTSAENLASYVLSRVLESMEFPPNIAEILVGVDEGPGQGAWISKRL